MKEREFARVVQIHSGDMSEETKVSFSHTDIRMQREAAGSAYALQDAAGTPFFKIRNQSQPDLLRSL